MKQKQIMTKVLSIFCVLVFAGMLQAQAATLATVNGKVITEEDLKGLVSNMPMQQQDILLKDPNTRQQLVQNLIDQELMVQDATAKKIENSKEYRDTFAAFRRQTMVNLLVKQQLSPKVTDTAVKAFFEKKKLRYSGDQVHAQHILVSTEKEATALLEEVKKPGADFQKIAEVKSKDPSAKNNRGDLGFFPRDQFDPAFSEGAFTTKVGEISEPIKSPFGYHLIKVIERKSGKPAEYAEVEQKVRSDYQKDLLQGYVDGLRRKAKIKQ